MSGPAVFELARGALRRLDEAAPAAEAARDAIHAIEVVNEGPPYTIAIGGELAPRTALLDYLAGERLFDPKRREGLRVVMTMRRGPVTSLRARRRDGSVETHTLGATASGALVVDEMLILDEQMIADVEASPASPPTVAPGASAGEQGRGPTWSEPANAGERGRSPWIVETSPASEETMVVGRPPWWALWSWLVLWLRSWLSGRRDGPNSAMQPIEANRQLVSAPGPGHKPRAAPSGGRGGVDPRRQFRDALHRLSSDGALEHISLHVAGGPLPETVVIVELPGAADATALGAAGVDACVIACGGGGLEQTPQRDALLASVPHVFAVGPVAIAADRDPRVRRLADFAAVPPALVHIAGLEREIRVGRRAIAALTRGRDILDGILAEAEARFRRTIDQLEARRIPNIDQLVAQELARLRPAIIEHAHRALRRALARVDTDITRAATEWTAALRDGATTEALRAAAAKLDEESPAALQRIRTEIHRNLVDELTEHARAQYLEIVSALREGTSRADPLPWIAVEVALGDASTGTSLGTVARRLTSLFRSLESLKADAVEHLMERVNSLRQVAIAIFSDAEPRLERAVTATIGAALRTDLEGHVAWIEAELVREHVAIDTECARLAPLVSVRDGTIIDEQALGAAVTALERALP